MGQYSPDRPLYHALLDMAEALMDSPLEDLGVFGWRDEYGRERITICCEQGEAIYGLE